MKRLQWLIGRNGTASSRRTRRATGNRGVPRDTIERTPRLERLEPRMLMAAQFLDGVLTITGTDGDDNVEVSAGAAAGIIVVIDAPGVTPNSTFSGVNALVITVGGGNDFVLLGSGMLDAGGNFLGARIAGGDGDDVLVGGDGDDVIAGGAGLDLLIGGGGENTVDFADAISGVSADLSLEQAQTVDGVETIRHFRHIIGSAFDDTLRGDANANHIDGGAGNDAIYSLGGDDVVVDLLGNNHVEGGAGHDNLTTGTGDDTVLGGDGNDIITDHGGVNTIDGGPGTNQISVPPPPPAPEPMPEAPPSVVDEASGDTDKRDPAEFALDDSGAAELSGSSAQNDKDAFAVTAEADGVMRFSVDASGGALEVVITDSRGKPLLTLRTDKNQFSGEVTVKAGQQYFVQVKSLKHAAVDYTVHAQMQAAAALESPEKPGKKK